MHLLVPACLLVGCLPSMSSSLGSETPLTPALELAGRTRHFTQTGRKRLDFIGEHSCALPLPWVICLSPSFCGDLPGVFASTRGGGGACSCPGGVRLRWVIWATLYLLSVAELLNPALFYGTCLQRHVAQPHLCLPAPTPTPRTANAARWRKNTALAAVKNAKLLYS